MVFNNKPIKSSSKLKDEKLELTFKDKELGKIWTSFPIGKKDKCFGFNFGWCQHKGLTEILLAMEGTILGERNYCPDCAWKFFSKLSFYADDILKNKEILDEIRKELMNYQFQNFDFNFSLCTK